MIPIYAMLSTAVILYTASHFLAVLSFPSDRFKLETIIVLAACVLAVVGMFDIVFSILSGQEYGYYGYEGIVIASVITVFISFGFFRSWS